jgi:hypothetical protein
MSEKTEEFLSIVFIGCRDKRSCRAISKNNGNSRPFKCDGINLMEMNVPVYTKRGKRNTQDSIIRQHDDFFFAGEVLLLELMGGKYQVKYVVVSEIFTVAGLAEGVLAVCFEDVVWSYDAVFRNESRSTETIQGIAIE